MQQRTRVAADTLYKDLVMVGSGSYAGDNPMALSYFFAPVMPFRQGRLQDDPPGTFRTDAITLMMVPATTAQSSIAQPMPAKSAELKVTEDPNCPPSKADQLCGFKEGMSVLIYDESGSYDLFTITEVQNQALHLQHNLDDLAKVYDDRRQDRPDPEPHLLPADRRRDEDVPVDALRRRRQRRADRRQRRRARVRVLRRSAAARHEWEATRQPGPGHGRPMDPKPPALAWTTACS